MSSTATPTTTTTSFTFRTPGPGVHPAPDLPPGWLWGHAPEGEPHDDIYSVHEATGSTQFAWPGDEASCFRFYYWLSEALKVDKDKDKDTPE